MSATLLVVYDRLLYLPRAHPALLASAWGFVLLRVTAGVLVCDFGTKVDGMLEGMGRHAEALVCVDSRCSKSREDGDGARWKLLNLSKTVRAQIV